MNTSSHALKAATNRTYAEKLPVRSKSCREGEKEKERQLQNVKRSNVNAKTRKAIAKLFALNANAKNSYYSIITKRTYK